VGKPGSLLCGGRTNHEESAGGSCADDALQRLAEVDPRASRIVELRYFVGLNNDEVASVIGVSEKTVTRDWNTAKAWLRAELRSQQ
jgi:RNA polymerase sigma factor (sigma-70 family)